MEFLDARRLTGPSLLFDGPAAILDVACTRDEADLLERSWRDNVGRMRSALGWGDCQYSRKDLIGGVSLAFTAQIDALYAASDINEWAWAVFDAQRSGGEGPDFDAALATLRASAADESNPPMLALQEAAAEHKVSFLWDDDEVSLGLGRSARVWPQRDIPQNVDWHSFSDIPVGLVTGTNGKTTTVRLATHIVRGSGLNVGLSSTDWIAVNDRIIDRGDWSGPGGARAVLRQNDVDVAILESARGGLLRRGLGVDRANAALITNIAEDHLGDFGSRNLDELLDVKWIVSRAVRDNGRLVLNADDPLLVGKSSGYPGKIVWFSLDAGNETVARHVAGGGVAFVLDDGQLTKIDAGLSSPVCRASEIPIAMGGAARHNVANSLAAAALTWCLEVSVDDIRRGLTTMSQDDNPGRCNIYDVDGCKVLVDFAHNPHAMAALFDMAEALPARRRILCFGQAGDRPDSLIERLARDAWAIGLDHVVVSELAKYHRGRAQGEVFGIIRDELLRQGADASQVSHHAEEVQSLQAALEWAEPGDLVIMLALGGAGPIRELLRERGASGA